MAKSQKDEEDGAAATLEELRREIDSLRRERDSLAAAQAGYIEEIGRLNQLTTELVDYVETIADAVSDALDASGLSDDLRKKVVDMILSSAQQMRSAVPER